MSRRNNDAYANDVYGGRTDYSLGSSSLGGSNGGYVNGNGGYGSVGGYGSGGSGGYGVPKTAPTTVRSVAGLGGHSDKSDAALADHIKKALSSEEVAPKQKHVRECILYTHDMKGSGSLWMGLKGFPMYGDEVVTFKGLVLVHKVINGGHARALKDLAHDYAWLENLGRAVNGFRGGYGTLIKTYLQFLTQKLEYHKIHPEYTGSFDYQEYVSLKGVEDPNEGFETINDLLNLLKRSYVMGETVFNNFRAGTGNECRISALVPLVEESFGIYQFCVSMLHAMHQIIGSVEVLAPLREKFNSSHHALYKFYYECAGLRYLTSLITIPKLDRHPPDFLEKEPSQMPKRPATPPQQIQEEDDAVARQQAELEAQIREENKRLEVQRQAAESLRQSEMQRQIELQRQQALLQQQRLAEEERIRQLQMQQQQQLEAQQYMGLLENLRNQTAKDREAIDFYEGRVRTLQQQLAQLQMQSNEGTVKALQDELNQWKQKYEALAKLYAQLRKEHFELLNKFKEIKEGSGKQADDVRSQLEKIKSEMRAKSSELTDVMVERDRLKNEADRIKLNSEEEIARLRRDLQDTKDSLVDMSKSKGAEVSSIVARYNAEKGELEQLNLMKQRMIDDLRNQLDRLSDEAQRLRNGQSEESAILQQGLDQTLLALAQMQKTQEETESLLLNQMRKLKNDHLLNLNRMMDIILQTCINQIDESIYELESPTTEGNQAATPEYVQSLLEKTIGSAGDFSASFIQLIEGGDQAAAIGASSSFAQSVGQLLFNVKGVVKLAKDDEAAEEIIRVSKAGGLASRHFFQSLQSNSLSTTNPSYRSQLVNDLARGAIMGLLGISPILENLAPRKDVLSTNGGDLGDLVEREMQAAAQAIDAAARRLEELMAQPPGVGIDMNVHQAILASAMALTNAIAQLIRCATISQQEIVAHGRSSSSTAAAFYKKNNKWTEGLVSAAKAVATATTYLVECADGLVRGTHSMEQLIVAAQEVGVSTTQLVAASRVKAVPFSKAQGKLEDAAVAVREATKLLVKAARDASKMRSEQLARDEIGAMGRHEMKIKEMEQQVKILELEKELNQARFKLGEIRKQGYADE
ncbi:sla2 Src-like adaptor 2 [Physocladia obscura]|uniref:Sla2 Src-like adaptor 2 n=1 Tax=Physocladia obscura TaxID=109957 RepID=A0AAD5XG26_9FUNG|nr:sla2 Src-like adaptor 2 [Physocladia obscura]